MKRIQRALLSVSDKTGLVAFARGLHDLEIQIISTGGTAALLRKEGIPATEIADFTGFPEILDGRVKTLHPKVHGAILARRSDKKHIEQTRRLGLQMIDLIVVNLYPFEETARKKGAALSELIEQIDIGGVALLRSAGKNFESVGIVSHPSQYEKILTELQQNRGKLSDETRAGLAVEAFAETASYDALIQQVLTARCAVRKEWPRRLVMTARRRQILRYGENPHQKAAWYEWISPRTDGLSASEQLHGKELSFNNLLDMEAAWYMVASFEKPCAVVVKHMNPCGIACASSLKEAFRNAWDCDSTSAFGGIVGFNRRVDEATARVLAESGFLECLIAPDYEKKALEILKSKKNLRIVRLPSRHSSDTMEIKQVSGGILVQQADAMKISPAQWKGATSVTPTASQKQDLIFAWRVARFVRSNAIVIVKGEKTVGIGAGQMSRVDSVRIAIEKAGVRAKGAVLASDGFFPKPDGPALAIRAGIRAIVQPGGSIQDPAVIAAAQKAKIPMLLTGERHFRH